MAGTRGRGLFVVGLDIASEHEAEFNRWYDEEHLAARLAIPGTIGGRRFVAVDGSPRYLTIYELENPEVVASEGFRGYQASANDKRMSQLYDMKLRSVYRDITPEG